MNKMYNKFVEWFLRVAIAAGFLSASADRFGWWPAEVSAWGNWKAFEAYTASLLFYLPDWMVTISAGVSTILEVIFGIALLTTFKTPLIAFCSGVLTLIFAMGMVIGIGIKAPLDYSAFTASAAAFALSIISYESGKNKRH